MSQHQQSRFKSKPVVEAGGPAAHALTTTDRQDHTARCHQTYAKHVPDQCFHIMRTPASHRVNNHVRSVLQNAAY
jgi:hypothetical protein